MSIPTTDPRAQMIPARIAEVRPLRGQPKLAVFSIRPEAGDVGAFIPGQHATLCWEHDGQPLVRAYSIASAPQQRDHLEFYVGKVERPGAPSTDLFTLGAGARLWLGLAAGSFTLARTDRRHVALVASGTGLAPYVSMLRHLRQGVPAGLEAITLWHGVREPEHLAYREELEEFERRAPLPFLYIPTASRAGPDQRKFDPHLSAGRVNELLARVLGLPGGGDPRGAQLAPALDERRLRELLPPGDCAIFLCGSNPMVRSVITSTEGSPYAAYLVYDRYW